MKFEYEGVFFNLITLFFHNKALEGRYIEYFNKNSVQQVRNAIVLSVGLWLVALITLWFSNPSNWLIMLLAILLFVCPVYGTLWVLTNKTQYWRFLQPILALKSTILFCFALFLTGHYLQSPELLTTGIILTIFFAYIVFPMLFPAAAVTTFLIILGASLYLYLAPYFSHESSLHIILGTLVAWFAASYAGYLKDLSQRQDFILRQKITSTNVGVRKQTYMDGLTNLFNRQYLMGTFRDLLSPPITSSFAIACIDLDHLKKINTANGRSAGDTILVELAEIILDSIRQSDIPIRYDGEEFVILMKDTSLEDALTVVERMRIKTASHSFSGLNCLITFSAGIAMMEPNDLLEKALDAAQQQLALAKKQGCNRTVVADIKPAMR